MPDPKPKCLCGHPAHWGNCRPACGCRTYRRANEPETTSGGPSGPPLTTSQAPAGQANTPRNPGGHTMPNPTDGVRIELVAVTPKLAREWLGRNAENQRLRRDTKVDQYARDMAAGHWPITGDTVKVTADNKLLDGQHRMAAVIQADITVPMLIAYGVPAEVMTVLDTGLARTFTDVLRISGAPSRSVLGAVVRRIVQWESGNYLGTSGGGQGAPTNIEMLERYEKEPDAFDSAAARAGDVRRMRLGQSGPAGAAFFLFTQLDQERAHQFFDQYVSGADLAQSHPILSLRNRIVRIGKDERLYAHEQLALFIRAWNAWREDKPLDRVMVTSGGRKLTNASFPQPK